SRPTGLVVSPRSADAQSAATSPSSSPSCSAKKKRVAQSVPRPKRHKRHSKGKEEAAVEPASPKEVRKADGVKVTMSPKGRGGSPGNTTAKRKGLREGLKQKEKEDGTNTEM